MLFTLTQPVLHRRIESALILAACIWWYFSQGYSGLMFALLFMTPDFSIAAYWVNKRVGGIVYNLAHFYGWGVMLFLVGHLQGQDFWMAIGLIWMAHCAFDRTLGWGLKFEGGFCDTDMGQKELPVDTPQLR